MGVTVCLPLFGNPGQELEEGTAVKGQHLLNLAADMKESEIPLTPWGRGVYNERIANNGKDHPGVSALHAAPNQRRASGQIQPDPENVEQFALKLPGRSCPGRASAAEATRHRMGAAAHRLAH